MWIEANLEPKELLQDILKGLSNPPQNPTALAVINAQNKAGNTALHWAALNGHLESVKVLLDQGAGKPFSKTEHGNFLNAGLQTLNIRCNMKR